ncbi:F-box and associated interaction domains-containing protein [Thalictrum thalictroides]|uniref:F-box and associated interaction domains-containing protein n=1 Tax=Thalictrum thalictroides TaxID=46969 RepID=A0A7J6V2R4_THATH|nr:F-box and associated interaction domains-containing protein [Thalictrum thalictroides]
MGEVEYVDHQHHLLPRDLIFSILVRLPVKFLIRLESVCKQWRSFIKDANFISMYIKYQRKHNARILILVHSGYDRKLYSINIKGLGATTCRLHNFFIATTSEISYCNGLLSYYSFSLSLVLVHNPSTAKEWFMLRRSEHVGTPRGFGFGFDSSANEYKVVLFGPSHCQVYTIGTGLWRPTKNRPILNYKDDHIDYYMSPVFVNGALHWLSCKDIISFDLKSEEFGVIPFPNGVSGEEFYWRLCLSQYYLLELREQLCMVCPGNVTDSNAVDLWILKDWNNNVWVKEDSFVLPPNWSSSCTLSTTPEGEIFVAGCKDISFSRYYIHSYNPQSRMTKKIEFVGKDFSYFRVINHVESPFRL